MVQNKILNLLLFEIYAAFIKLSLMKKILLLVFSFFLFSSCDDGELTLESFNFENQTIQKCTDNYLLFKTKNDELLLLNVPVEVYTTLFASSPTNGTPREASIGGTNEILYRKYSGNLTSATVCSLVPVSSPTVTKEWIATGGKILVETNEVFDTNDVLVKYSHNITFQNVNFASVDNSFSFESYIFGNHEINVN